MIIYYIVYTVHCEQRWCTAYKSYEDVFRIWKILNNKFPDLKPVITALTLIG